MTPCSQLVTSRDDFSVGREAPLTSCSRSNPSRRESGGRWGEGAGGEAEETADLRLKSCGWVGGGGGGGLQKKTKTENRAARPLARGATWREGKRKGTEGGQAGGGTIPGSSIGECPGYK